MYWFLIALIISILLTCITAPESFDWDEKPIRVALANFIGFSLFGILFAMFMAIVCGTLSQNFPEPNKNITEILSLQDNIASEGRFFLGSGIIKGENRYWFYKNYGDGYRSDSLPSINTTIYEDEDIKPYIVTYSKNFEWRNWSVVNSSPKDNEIHVPKNTLIKNVYELDLKN